MFVGANGAGKTAVLLAMLRMFGISNEQRRVRYDDFHVAVNEEAPPSERSLSIDAILAFPELDETDELGSTAVPSFFHQMAAAEDGTLKCRIRLDSIWTDDGSIDGFVETTLRAITTLRGEYVEDDEHKLSVFDRSRIQMIYVPANRDASSQVSQFLKGRLWRAINWSENLSNVLADSGQTLNDSFDEELSVQQVTNAVQRRWHEVCEGETESVPFFSPIDLRLQEFIRNIEVVFRPVENGRERNLRDLSDGQDSLFHIAMTSATLDIENGIASGIAEGFNEESLALPAMTILAIEEPENNLAPYFLSRIVSQVQDVTGGSNAQAIISSHSSGILARVRPEQVRHFRLQPELPTAIVRGITLPASAEAAGKFVREAVRAHPELYFAKFVVLCEGDSEQIILPRIAEAMGVAIDRSFVAVVPLGGRHVNHFWKLLHDLEIPFATLLDFDMGRNGGGWGRIKSVCKQLVDNGHNPREVFGDEFDGEPIESWLEKFDGFEYDEVGLDDLEVWIKRLRKFDVYFCRPLDLDWSMFKKFKTAYTDLEDGMEGPSSGANAKRTVLGPKGILELYEDSEDENFRWYRYLFLGRGKPATHFRVISALENEEIREKAPLVLKRLIEAIRTHIDPPESRVTRE